MEGKGEMNLYPFNYFFLALILLQVRLIILQRSLCDLNINSKEILPIDRSTRERINRSISKLWDALGSKIFFLACWEGTFGRTLNIRPNVHYENGF